MMGSGVIVKSNYKHMSKIIKQVPFLLAVPAFITALTITAVSEDAGPEAVFRKAIISSAKKYIGTGYRYGGRGEGGFDCSGFVQFIFREHGILLPRTAAGQFEQGEKIDLSQAAPGDLLFFKIDHEKITHVGIYAGNSEFIHAPSTGKKVTIDSVEAAYWKTRFAGAVTLIQKK
jgi:cell wall-associated NlpC family hydrolase